MALHLNEALPETVDVSQIRVLTIQLKLAVLKLRTGQAVAKQSPAAQLHWQVELISGGIAAAGSNSNGI